MKLHLKISFLVLIACIALAFALKFFLSDLDSFFAVLTDRPGSNGNIYFYFRLTKEEYLKTITIRLLFTIPIFIASHTLIKNINWKGYLLFLAVIIVYIIAFIFIENKFLIWVGKG